MNDVEIATGTRMIWKFPVSIAERFSVEMPAGAEILTVQMQGDTPCMWAIVDPDAFPEIRNFRMAGTGHELGQIGRHIGTVQMAGGALIWHFFEAE